MSRVGGTKEGKWIEVKNMANKVRFMCQDQFGKTSINGCFGGCSK